LVSSPLFYVTFGIVGGVAVVSQFEDAALLLSALPIVGLTVLSKTDFGTRLEGAIVDRRPALDAAEAAAEVQRAVARAASPHYGAGRSKFLGPLAFDSAYPPHLVGELPGDYGFDPLNLSASPESLDRNQELELLHARWAMLGVVGVVVPELLTEVGALPLAESVWWKVGAAKLGGESLNYLGIGGFVIAGKQGVAVIAACQAWKCDQGGGGRGAALVTRPCHSTLSPTYYIHARGIRVHLSVPGCSGLDLVSSASTAHHVHPLTKHPHPPPPPLESKPLQSCGREYPTCDGVHTRCAFYRRRFRSQRRSTHRSIHLDMHTVLIQCA
jgi:hypothetical protein